MQFAYYESSLAVEFIVQRFGFAKLKALLADLATGADANQAIAKHTKTLPELDQEFAVFAREKAERMGSGLDWEKPPLATMLGQAEEAWDTWAKSHPTNYWVLTRAAEDAIESENWAEAKTTLNKLVEALPDPVGAEKVYGMLAKAYRELEQTNEEKRVATLLAEKVPNAPQVYMRLMELAAGEKNWKTVTENANRYLAANPLVSPPYRFLLQAAEHTGETEAGIRACRALLVLDPPNPVELHFKLAQMLHRAGAPEAKREVLLALEEAPRYRAALELLLEMQSQGRSVTNGTPVVPGRHF
jgi:tetratricopeptide (TPR) repeat protein